MTATDVALDIKGARRNDVDPADLKTAGQQVALALFVAVPFAAVVAATPILWGWGLNWRDVVIAVAMYAITGHGVTIGFHRHFTHHAFRAKRWLQVSLAIAGSMAIQGSVLRWVADHRKHHRFSDREGDPHSPWRYGHSLKALTGGFFYAHLGWLFDIQQTSTKKFAPDLCEDRVISGISRTFPLWVALSMLIPPVVGGLWAWSWQGALWAFFWGSLVPRGAIAPRDLCNQLCVPHHRPTSVQDHGREPQRVVVGVTVNGRGLAQFFTTQRRHRLATESGAFRSTPVPSSSG